MQQLGYGGGCIRRARKENTPYARPSPGKCSHANYYEETAGQWVHFTDPRFGPAMRHVMRKVRECRACGMRIVIEC